jgi:hypothetical protein
MALMHRIFIIVGLVVILGVAGCASLSIDPRLVGTYSGTNSEALVFLSDMRVFHTRTVNGSEDRHFLGFYGSRRSEPGYLGLAGPDTSPFLGTSFRVTDDFSTVTASWNHRRRLTDSWQITYHKGAKAN